MWCVGVTIQFILYILYISASRGDDDFDGPLKTPSVGISVLVRNKYHTLPYFLTCLSNLNYPKDRIYIWFHSDFNQDNSDDILEKWVERHASEYNGVYLTSNKSSGPLHPDEDAPTQWTPMHFEHIITLRQSALEYTRRLWADFLFMLDADVFLTDRDSLRLLVEKDRPVVAPMLLSDGLYSNFWGGMTEDYYYQRTDEYKEIQARTKIGCFDVPMVHSALLISLRRTSSDRLSYRPVPRYRGPKDDIIVFAVTALEHGIPLTVCNDRQYGFVPVPLEDSDDLKNDYEQLLNVKLNAAGHAAPLPLAPEMAHLVRYPDPWKYGCGQVYLINLRRRPERLALAMTAFKELGMAVKRVEAVDGQEMEMTDLRRQGVRMMPGYEDPYHKRPMKAGEVGCFLSHYYIWKEIADQGYETALVFEDDIHFVPYFRHRFFALMNEIRDLDWDLLYLGRKILHDGEEESVTEHATRPRYSYWTLAYALTARGARKLLAARPLANMLPVDEFLPIMFNQHPNATWSAHFPERNLNALSASPLLVHPTHYTGQDGYISDTEDSLVVEQPPAQPSSESAEENAKVLVGEVGVKLREHYGELSACLCAVEEMAQALGERLAGAAPDPCGAERRALEACYCGCRGETLRCDSFVRLLAQCARTHAQKRL